MIKKIYSVSIGILLFSAAFAQTHEEHSIKDYKLKAQAFIIANHLENTGEELLAQIVTDKSKLEDFKKYSAEKQASDRHDFFVRIGEGEITSVADYKKFMKEKKSEYIVQYSDFINKSKGLNPNPVPFGPGEACQNMDFESTTFTGWEASYGSATDPTLTAGFDNPGINSATGQHVIMTTGNDPNVPSIPCVMPGGTASMRLGDNGNGGRKGAKISQTFHVFPGNPYFMYNYAVVLEDAGHPIIEQPYFKIRIYDASNNPISCASLDIDATNAPGLTATSTLKYKNWTQVLVPLSPYIGQDVRIEFITADCDAVGGTHDGYAYIDGSCNYIPSVVPSNSTVCSGQNTTLTGPAGLGSYSWSGPGIVSGGSSQVVTINAPGTYTLNLTTETTPPNAPCSFSMTYTIDGIISTAEFTSDVVCIGSLTHFTDGSSSDTTITNWSWDFNADGISDATGTNPTYTFPSAGTFPVTLTITAGACTAAITHNVTVSASGSPTVTGVPTLCSNAGIFNLSANVGGGVWSGTGITDAATGAFDPASASTTTPNIITYVTTGACAGTDTIHISVVPSASPAWTGTALCSSDSPINLNTLLTGTSGGTWSGTGVTGSTFNPAGLSGPISVTYTVGSAPCVGVQTQTITVTPRANATITSVAPMCADASSTTLTAVNTGGVWSGSGVNSSTGVFNPATAGAGTHIITYSIAGACGALDTVSISVLPVGNPAWVLPASICGGDAPINLATLVTGTPGGTFSGSGVTGSQFSPAGLSGNVTITYTVGVSPCANSQSFVIFVDEIDADFTATPTSGPAPLPVDFINESSSAVSYNWTFGDGTSSTNTNPSIIYDAYGTYVVTLIATNSTGCPDTARVTIHVEGVSILTVPNVFTPNGDGDNDIFQAVIAKGLISFEAAVFDRWGLKMYSWTNSGTGWNGQSKNGSTAPDGTYYYIIKASGIDGKEYEYTGFVSLIRQ